MSSKMELGERIQGFINSNRDKEIILSRLSQVTKKVTTKITEKNLPFAREVFKKSAMKSLTQETNKITEERRTITTIVRNLQTLGLRVTDLVTMT